MQASELYDLIKTKLPKAAGLHYNAVGYALNGRTHYFSPAGDEYYSIIKQEMKVKQPGTLIEYHTPTHIYTLNNCFLETTIELHNQFRTIMSAENITVPRCVAHEVVEYDYDEWVYNAFEKPVANAKSVQELITVLPDDNSAVWNNWCVHGVTTLNALAKSPMGTKIWPDGWGPQLGLMDYYRNADSEWYWKPPLAYTNRYSLDPSIFAKEALSGMFGAKRFYDLNPHIHINPQLNLVYLDNLDNSVYDIAVVRGD